MTILTKEKQDQEILLTKEEMKLIRRIRQLCRKPKPCLIIVQSGCFLSWWVADTKES